MLNFLRTFLQINKLNNVFNFNWMTNSLENFIINNLKNWISKNLDVGILSNNWGDVFKILFNTNFTNIFILFVAILIASFTYLAIFFLVVLGIRFICAVGKFLWGISELSIRFSILNMIQRDKSDQSVPAAKTKDKKDIKKEKTITEKMACMPFNRQERKEKIGKFISDQICAGKKDRNNMFVIDFSDSINLNKQVEMLYHTTTEIIRKATKKDEVLIKVDSCGGPATTYGMASKILESIKSSDIRITCSVSEYALSGGYMLACVADKIITSPFALLGSVGVISQMININEILSKNGAKVVTNTAGKSKAGLDSLGEITEEKQEKVRQMLNSIHKKFIQHVTKHRKLVSHDILDGSIFIADQAKENNLIDEIKTEIEFIEEKSKNFNIIEINTDNFCITDSKKDSILCNEWNQKYFFKSLK